jgi:hypothetical protein
MRLPSQRLTVNLAEYNLLKPGLDVLANGLASAKLGHFPHRHPWHQVDWEASNVYRNQEYNGEMSARMIRVRGKLWELTQSRKLRADTFELAALALALRVTKAQRLVEITEATLADIALLESKIETTGTAQNGPRPQGWDRRSMDHWQTSGGGMSTGCDTTCCIQSCRRTEKHGAPNAGGNNANKRRRLLELLSWRDFMRPQPKNTWTESSR